MFNLKIQYKNQPEQKHENLSGERIKELVSNMLEYDELESFTVENITPKAESK